MIYGLHQNSLHDKFSVEIFMKKCHTVETSTITSLNFNIEKIRPITRTDFCI